MGLMCCVSKAVQPDKEASQSKKGAKARKGQKQSSSMQQAAAGDPSTEAKGELNKRMNGGSPAA